MLVKRLGVVVVSFAIGYGLTLLIVRFIGTTVAEYGTIYTFFTALSLAIAIGIWLDKFLKTGFLPE